MNDAAKIERYKELLIRRDSLKKDCDHIWLQYVKQFGNLLESLFRQKIECIALKKKIACCQSRLNRKEPFDPEEIEKAVQAELSAYYEALQDICDARESKFHPIPPADLLKIKKVYRRIASRIHPDLHPELFRQKEIRDLWQQAKNAYIANDLPALQETEFLILQTIGKEGDEADAIENSDERIAALQKEIGQILSSLPYQYKYILEDSSLTDEESRRLQEEITSYQVYSRELQEHFDSLQDRFAQTGFTGVLS